jgi:hypothetical protein
MTRQIYNKEHLQWVSGKIVEIARDILSGKVGIIASAHKLYGAGCQIGADGDPDFVFFTAIDSETHEFCIVGEARKRWSPEALQAKDTKLTAYEAKIREEAFEICRRLIQKYEGDVANTSN